MFSFRFQEKLMGIVLRKDPEFVFYARTISRTSAMDHTGKERRSVETGTKDIMDFFVGMENEAMHLFTTFLNRGSLIKK